MDGWIKIHRKILDWEWFDNGNMLKVLLYLIFRANYEDKLWHGIVIKRGQLVTSLGNLSGQLRMTINVLRLCLKKLEKAQTITIQSTNRYTLITVCKYDDYQLKEEDEKLCNEEEATNKTQTKNKQTTTTKEYNNKNKKKLSNKLDSKEKEENLPVGNDANLHILDSARHRFIDELAPYVATYGKDMMNEFYEYWTEPNTSKTKMRFQLERTWDTNLRLKTWARRSKIKPHYADNRRDTEEEQKAKRMQGYADTIDDILNGR